MSTTLTRRRLLQGAAAISAMPMPFIAPRRARAAPAFATNFPDTSAFFVSDGNIANMGQSGTGFVSLNLRATGDNQVLMTAGPVQTIGRCPAYSRAAQIAALAGEFDIWLWGDHPGATCNGQQAILMQIPFQVQDYAWHQAVFAWDLGSSQVYCVVDGVSLNGTAQVFNGTDVATNWAGPVQISSPGDLTEIAVFAGGSFMDPRDPSILSCFWDSNNGAAAEPGSWINLPDGRRPQIYLTGPPGIFGLNAIPGVATLTDYQDTSPPSGFYPVGTPPQMSGTDPWWQDATVRPKR